MAYEFKEYPKWIKLPDGTDMIVQDRAEENEKLGIEPEKQVPPETVTHTVDPSPDTSEDAGDGDSDDPDEAEPSPKRKPRKK